MKDFFYATLTDMQCGRESWRVMLTLMAAAFVLAFLIGLA